MAFGTGTTTCFLWFLDIIHSSTPQHRVVEYRVSGSGIRVDYLCYAILGSHIVIGDAEVAAIKLSCFPLGYRDFESRTLKPFPFGRALNQPGRELQTPVLCLNGPTWGKTGKECGRDN